MIEINRNNVGLFGWDGRSSLRDATPCNQPGNGHLRPDDGNRRIDGNMGRLVHGEILCHLRAVRVCVGIRRGGGTPILFAGVSFVHGDLPLKTTGHLIKDRRIPPFSSHFPRAQMKSQIKRSGAWAGIGRDVPQSPQEPRGDVFCRVPRPCVCVLCRHGAGILTYRISKRHNQPVRNITDTPSCSMEQYPLTGTTPRHPVLFDKPRCSVDEKRVGDGEPSPPQNRPKTGI